MKITLFTSNNIRHNYLINLLSEFSEELNVIQECGTIFPGLVPGHYPKSDIFKNYFEKVLQAQNKFFANSHIKNMKKINLLPILFGDLNKCSLSFLSNLLKSDIYIVHGSSYIKGELVDFLIKKKTINIHMGVSPYYRGCDCNFWALFDDNPHLVGSTIHMLSKGLDSGSILYHAMSKVKSSPFDYTMSTVKSAFHSIVEKIKDESILDLKPEKQDKLKEIRYSKSIEFNEKAINQFFRKKIDLNVKDFDNSLLKNPYFFEG